MSKKSAKSSFNLILVLVWHMCMDCQVIYYNLSNDFVALLQIYY